MKRCVYNATLVLKRVNEVGGYYCGVSILLPLNDAKQSRNKTLSERFELRLDDKRSDKRAS